jgi:hypothetical protein
MSEVVSPPAHITIPGDVLVPDEEFCRDVLGGAARRTARRYERAGLPHVLVRGRKYRPLNAGRAWLASRIKVQVYTPKRRRTRSSRERSS